MDMAMATIPSMGLTTAPTFSNGSHGKSLSPSSSFHHSPHFSSFRRSNGERLSLVVMASSSFDFFKSSPSSSPLSSSSSSSSGDVESLSNLLSSLGEVPPPPIIQKPDEFPVTQLQEKEVPPGLTHYETMAVLRPDITEDDRISLTDRYEEAIIASGGMGVEVFNRGMMPLAYNIKKKNMGGLSNKYLDGIYFLFTYFGKPDSQESLELKLNQDDDVIRHSTYKVKPFKARKSARRSTELQEQV